MEKVIGRAEFEGRGRRMVLKEGAKRVLVLESGGRVFAVDDRCPHEGYPLSQGSLDEKSCVLTCNWHNWKFDLATGRCVVGGDNVRTWPVREDGDAIRVDLSDPGPAETEARIMGDLKAAFEERGRGRMTRNLARLALGGLDPRRALGSAVLWSADRLEFGTAHGYAGAADWLALHAGLADREDRLICLAEALDHISQDVLRRPARPFAAGGGADWDPDALLAAVEDEDAERAEAAVAAGFDKGLRFDGAGDALARAALAHYNDFGHSLIYAVKSAQLAKALDDPRVDRALALALARSLCRATREDLLPRFKGYRPALEDLESRPPGTDASPADAPDGPGVGEALRWLAERWGTSAPASLHGALLLAAAKNMLRFDADRDAAVDVPVSGNVDWLFFTHPLTFANAVRRTCERRPELWAQGLAQMACFVGRNRAHLGPAPGDVRDVGDEEAFRARVVEKLLDNGEGLPIFGVHLLKTSLAVFEEARALGGAGDRAEGRKTLLAALDRFLSSPLKRKHARRAARQALALAGKDLDA